MIRSLPEESARLRLALDAGKLGTWRWDIATGHVEWDEGLERLWGYEPGGFDGSFDAYAARLHPDDRDAVLEKVRLAVDARTSYVTEHRVLWPDGTIRWLQGRGDVTVDDDDRVTGTVGVVVDITDRVLAEHERLVATDRLRKLHRATAALASAITTDAVLDAVVDDIVEIAGAVAGSVALVVGDEVVVARAAGYSEEIQRRFERFSVDSDLAHAVAVRTGEPVAVEDDSAIREELVLEARPARGHCSVPLLVDGKPIGAIGLTFATPQRFDPDQLDFLVALAHHAAASLDRARLYESAQRAAEAREASAQRLGLLAEASAVLGASLEVDDTLAALADLLVSRLVPSCEIDVIDRTAGPRTVATRGADQPADETAIIDVPLVVRGVTVGWLRVAVPPAGLESADVELLEQVATRAAVAVDNARLFARASRAAQRTAALQRATAALSGAVRVDQVAEVVLDQARAATGAAWVAFGIVGKSAHRVRFLSVAESGGERGVRWDELSLNAAGPIAEAARTGKASFLIGRDEFAARWPDVARDPSRVQYHSWAHLPLDVAGDVIGVIAFAWDHERTLSDDERTLIWGLVAQAAQALDRARLFEVEHEIADTLQTDLAPPVLPAVPGVELAARYRPAGERAKVGGDFYDVVPFGGAVATEGTPWLVLIGDVCGTGPAAASMTGQVRHTARALARVSTDLAALVNTINDVLVVSADDERFCTLAASTLTETPTGVRAAVVSAGHPQPLLLHAAGGVSVVPSEGAALGMFAEVDHRPVIVDLAPGDALVFVTDGVLEARSIDGAFFGDDGLAAAVASAAGGGADDIAAIIDHAVVDFAGGDLDDDAAVVVVRAQPRT